MILALAREAPARAARRRPRPRRRSRSRASRRPSSLTLNADGSVLAHRRRSPCASAASSRSTRRLPRRAGRGDRPHRHQRRGQVDAAQRDRRLRAEPTARSSSSARDVSALARAPPGARRARPHVPGRHAVPRAHRARDRAARARSPAHDLVLGQRCCGSRPSIAHGAAQARARPPSSSTSSASAATPTASSPSCRPAPAASSSSRRCSRSRRASICLDEPTAGVAQREAEAFGPLIKRVQQELDATLVVVEHDLPLILSISDRVYCMEAGTVIAEGTPARRAQQPRSSSRRTSAPTTARSSAVTRNRPNRRQLWDPHTRQ